jgi:hypothetical protein
MKSTVLVVCVAIAALALVSILPSSETKVNARTQGQSREDKTPSPYFYVQGDPFVDHLPLKDSRVQIDVSRRQRRYARILWFSIVTATVTVMVK